MSGPENGKYRITPVTKPVPIGADFGLEPVKSVVAFGDDNIWTVEQLTDGNYHLTLKETGRWRYSRLEGNNVVVDIYAPLGDPWTIQGAPDQRGGPYSIEVPGCIFPATAWTLRSLDPKSPVIAIPSDFPQLWKFTPVL